MTLTFVFTRQEVISEAHTRLESLDGVTSVHGRFYEMCSNYHKLMGDHAEYYRDALRYLGCTNLTAISSEYQSFKLL